MTVSRTLTIITIVLLALILLVGWKDILEAIKLLGQVNLWILLLLIPIQFLSYLASGSIIFSYLRSKNNLEGLTRVEMTKISLELNFVNHILPSGGAAGFSYLGWVLKKYGVRLGRSTIAQAIRYFLTFIAFIFLLFVSIIFLAIDNQINQTIIVISISFGVTAVVFIFAGLYLMHKKSRISKFSAFIRKTINKLISLVTFSKKKNVLKKKTVDIFFEEFHSDYEALLEDKTILLSPIGWSLASIVLDVCLLFIAFWSLGFVINPALLMISFGVSSIASLLPVTPGGTGIYEAVMITFLSSAGITPDAAIAGTLLARFVLLSGTIAFGYLFYQIRINTYGNKPT